MKKYSFVQNIFSGGDKAHIANCNINKKPRIEIAKKGKYADIGFDGYSEYDQMLCENTEIYNNLLMKYGELGISKEDGATTSHAFYKIPINNSEALAEELFDTIEQLVDKYASVKVV